VTYLAARDAATTAQLVVHSDEIGPEGRRPYGAHIDALIRELSIASMPMRDGWRVTSHHRRTPLCEDKCCPDEPPDAITGSVASASLVYAGSSADTFTAPAPFTGDDGTREAIAACRPDGWPEELENSRAQWAQVLERPATLTARTAQELAGAFQHSTIRDYLMTHVITTAPDQFTSVMLGVFPARPDWARVDTAQEVAFELMKATPEGQRAPMLCLIGWLEWLKGKSSFAARYFKLAMDDVPGFRLAFLLAELVNRGIVADVALNKATAYAPPART
jgi:hypothetical protein